MQGYAFGDAAQSDVPERQNFTRVYPTILHLAIHETVFVLTTFAFIKSHKVTHTFNVGTVLARIWIHSNSLNLSTITCTCRSENHLFEKHNMPQRTMPKDNSCVPIWILPWKYLIHFLIQIMCSRLLFKTGESFFLCTRDLTTAVCHHVLWTSTLLVIPMLYNKVCAGKPNMPPVHHHSPLRLLVTDRLWKTAVAVPAISISSIFQCDQDLNGRS